MYKSPENAIQEKSFQFALDIIELYKKIIRSREYVLSRQLLKSGTSIGANVEEALGAQSRKDFISKLSISLKEARETRYWLLLFKKSAIVNIEITKHLANIDEILRLLTKIIKTSKKNNEKL